MVIRHEDLVGTYEQKRALVAQFNLTDDDFFSVVMENKAASEYLLTALLGKPIKVIDNKTQYSIRNIENHSIVLDLLVEDEEHNVFDVEIQTSNEKNHERRMRYYRAAIDWSYLEKGRDYSELPELYMIFISEFDAFKQNRNHYEVKQLVGDAPYDDGVHCLFFNTEVDDGTGLSKLLQYLKHSDADNNSFGALSEAVRYHKANTKGVDIMCEAVREYAKGYAADQRNEGRLEGKIEAIKNMLKENIPLETALKYAEIDKATYEEHTKADISTL